MPKCFSVLVAFLSLFIRFEFVFVVKKWLCSHVVQAESRIKDFRNFFEGDSVYQNLDCQGRLVRGYGRRNKTFALANAESLWRAFT